MSFPFSMKLWHEEHKAQGPSAHVGGESLSAPVGKRWVAWSEGGPVASSEVAWSLQGRSTCALHQVARGLVSYSIQRWARTVAMGQAQ
jgi:hypothetical protein